MHRLLLLEHFEEFLGGCWGLKARTTWGLQEFWGLALHYVADLETISWEQPKKLSHWQFFISNSLQEQRSHWFGEHACRHSSWLHGGVRVIFAFHGADSSIAHLHPQNTHRVDEVGQVEGRSFGAADKEIAGKWWAIKVYSSVHCNNSIIHNLLMKAISYCREQGKEELLQ